ncbi:MAG TPA: RHS repeat-associated core domain-containing protein [Polyangiaceae bacterium]|nr:RHS repeat-associated core domain-containing protein [Polyangiaceae bacterium]
MRETRYVDATSSLTWNAKYGVITSLTEPNGHETRVQYDALGRVTAIVKPGDSDERPTLRFERVVASPLSSVVTRAREQSGTDNVLDTVEVVDGLGRKRGSFSESTQPGNWILSDYSQFDARGNPRFTAYASEATGIVMPALSAALPGTTYVRDALGRVVVSRHPDGAEARTEYSPFSVTSWDENDSDPASPHYGTPTTTISDAHGRVRSVIERDAGREIVTGQYAYDGLGNLLSVTDALGRTRLYSYDGRSRRTTINDPNAGTWTMTYTDGNDLESRVGPDGSRLSFLYDSFGRAVEERHSSPTVPERVAARYHYDTPSLEHPEYGNTLGQLAWVEDDAGTKYFRYDDRGRLTDSTRKWFDGVEHYDWTDYDAQERMVRRGFPDRTHLSVSYDSRGLLSSIGSLATQLKWNVDGKLSSVTLGNGITDVHAYDTRRRLISMSATDSAGTMVRGFSLGLDAASRVMSITDLRPNLPVDESMTASFLYDSRYRLRQASYAAGTTTWELDDLAKITKVSSTFAEPHLNVTNTYGDSAGPGVGPDQLIRHGNEVLTYDAAGRVATDGERQLSWDAKGRLARVVRAGVTEEYVYGYDNNRALKKTTKSDGTVELTRYIAEDIEERDGNLIRYAFLGEQRLARLDPVDAGKRATPVTKTLVRMDSSGMESSGRLASRTESGIFSRANALRALWTICAVTLVLAAVHILRRRYGGSRFHWAYSGLVTGAVAACVFIACGSSSNNQSKELSVTERLRAESVEITTVPEGAEFYLPDAQVTPLAVTKANGQVRSRSLYHAYGQVRAQIGEHTDPFGFVGNEEDRGSGLSDFNARPYRPGIGIFYAVDPLALFEPEKTIGAPSRLFAYAYAGGDPINSADASGLVAWGDVARGLGAQALDAAKGAAQAVVQQAKSDIAMLSEGRIADFAKTMLVDRSPIMVGAQGLSASIEGVASLVDDVKNVFNAESDYEAGRLALKPLLTVVSVGATVAGASGAGKLLMGRGVRPKLPVGRGGGACAGGRCGGLIKCFVAGTLVASGGGFVPIEDLRLGDRVEVGNSACDDDRWPNDALAVALEMPHPDEPESMLSLQFVRPKEWLRAAGIEVEGQSTWSNLNEMGIAGWATVTAINEPPAVAAGPGCLVLMTVRHVASELLRLTLANGTEPLVLTPGHLLYVEGRGWTAARDVVDGDVLRSDSGPADVESVESVEAGRAVYNVEVAREHTYRVSTARVWAHNECLEGGGRQFPNITAEHLRGKSPTELRQYATEQGLVPHATKTDKFMDPATGKERLRIDSGHVDPRTGLSYNDPKAAVPHAHGYEPDGKTKIRDPSDGNPHFPTR